MSSSVRNQNRNHLQRHRVTATCRRRESKQIFEAVSRQASAAKYCVEALQLTKFTFWLSKGCLILNVNINLDILCRPMTRLTVLTIVN